MKFRRHIVLCFLALVIVPPSTNVTTRGQLVTGGLPRPAHIGVYQFAAAPDDLLANSAVAGRHSEDATSQTVEHIAAGRNLKASTADCGCGTPFVD